MRRAVCTFTLACLAVTGCSEAQQARETAAGVSSGAGKVRDCAALATDAAQARVQDARQVDAQDVQRAAERVAERARGIENSDVRSAAEKLQQALEQAAEAARQDDTSALREARQQVTDAARGAAEACGLPTDSFT